MLRIPGHLLLPVFLVAASAINGQPSTEAPAAPAAPTSELTPELLSKLEVAAQHVKANQLQEALAAYNEFLSIRPDLFTPYLDRGKVHLSLKEYAKAVEDFSSALKLKPDLFEAYMRRGMAYYDLREFAKAISDSDSYIKLKPGTITFEPFYYKGMAHAGLREYDKATAAFKSAFELNNDLPEAHMLLGRIYTEQDQLLNALREYSIVIQQRPSQKEAFRLRAAVKSVLGDLSGSKDDLAKSQLSAGRCDTIAKSIGYSSF